MKRRPGFDLSHFLKWKKKGKNRNGVSIEAGWGFAVHLLFAAAIMTSESLAWEEGNDAVNVISVENMDALLGLRMVTELKSFEGVKTNESENRFEETGTTVNETGEPSETRYKRMVNYKWKTFPVSSHVYDLCSTDRCVCTTNVQNELVNVSCDFNNEEILLKPGSIPMTTKEILISNSRHLIISPETFSGHRQLQKVILQNLETLVISNSAFKNFSTTYYFNLTIENCGNLALEDYSFRNLNNPMTVTVANCRHVVFKKSIFYWFTNVRVKNVYFLKLEENTFSSEVRQDVESLPVSLSFINVTFHEIPNATFPLSGAKIVFRNCSINVIKTGAFNGIALVGVSFQSSRIKRIEEGAFSDRTLVQFLEFDDADIQYVDANVLSAAARLTIHNCRVEEIANRAFNVSTAYFKLLNNYFLKIRRYAFEIHNWNSITIEGNHFNELEPEFFAAPFSNVTRVTTEFKFLNNTLARVEIDVLTFVPNEFGLDSFVEGNVFEHVCHCDLETWIRFRTGDTWESFYKTSFCVISDLLEKCYNISEDYLNMKNYVENFCGTEKVTVCEDVFKTHRPNILVSLNTNDTERTVLGVIFLGLLSSIAIMVTVLIFVWIKSKSFCGSKRKSQIPNSSDCFPFCRSPLCNDENLVKSDSISRMNIHEYAEIQNHINYEQKQTNLTVEDDAEDEEETVECDNKATQTIPEELTQELIQSLREKLDDPENYNEARDMIEHLYDLIKVEESCNNNYNRSLTNSFVLDEEEEIGGIYEVIKSSKLSSGRNTKKRSKNGKSDVKSTGTRVPSPDKLSPITFTVARPKPTVVGEYVEPRDRKSNEYCELSPTHLVMPDVLASSQIKNETSFAKAHDYAEPFQKGFNMSQRPLPNKPAADPGPSNY